jgi:cytochrome b subunit of formate dehydrogenase
VYLVYRKRPPGLCTDLYMLAGACLSVIVCVTGFVSWLLIDASTTAAALLAIAVLVIAQAGAAAAWLRRVHAEQAR